MVPRPFESDVLWKQICLLFTIFCRFAPYGLYGTLNFSHPYYFTTRHCVIVVLVRNRPIIVDGSDGQTRWVWHFIKVPDAQVKIAVATS